MTYSISDNIICCRLIYTSQVIDIAFMVIRTATVLCRLQILRGNSPHGFSHYFSFVSPLRTRIYYWRHFLKKLMLYHCLKSAIVFESCECSGVSFDEYDYEEDIFMPNYYWCSFDMSYVISFEWPIFITIWCYY